MADDSTLNPKLPSADFTFMYPFWYLVNSIRGGAEAMRATSQTSIVGPAQPAAQLSQLQRQSRGPQSPFLPQLINEGAADYEYRRRHAPFTNIYSDILHNLSGKPFSKTCELDTKMPDVLKNLQNNIDGQGNSLHVFAGNFFRDAIDRAVDWILVDYTKVPPGATLAAEREMGARPYWNQIAADRMLAVYSTFVRGVEIIYHARIYEPATRQEDFAEEFVERVRVLNREPILDPATDEVTGFLPAMWELWEEVTVDPQATGQAGTTPVGGATPESPTTGAGGSSGRAEKEWQLVDGGSITIGFIPLVPLVIGRRRGKSWRVDGPLRDIANLQVEEFQQESNLKSIKELSAFPMLSGDGVSQPKDASGEPINVPVGPKTVLFAPLDQMGRHGQWKFIEPSAESLKFLREDLAALRTEMRDLGMQPLSTANLTVITTANVAMRAHSAVQAWALLLKDSLEQAWKITGQWLGQSIEPVVNVYTDFGVDMQAATELTSLQAATDGGTISKRLQFNELKRRGVLSDEADYDEDEAQKAEEQSNDVLQPEKRIDPITGMPVVVQPKPGTLNPPPPPVVPGGQRPTVQ